MVNLYISEYVIDEVCQSVGCFGSRHSDAANKWAVHCSLDESEDVLNAASVLRLDKEGSELIKQAVEDAILSKPVLACPNGLLVRNL